MIHLLIRGRNCAEHIPLLFRSLNKQTYQNFREVVILDDPTDDSAAVVKGTAIGKPAREVNYMVTDRHNGAALNLWKGMRMLKAEPEDIVAIVDAKDYLAPDSLMTVMSAYSSHPDTLCTYGSYVKLTKGRKTSVSQSYNKFSEVRSDLWHGSHLKTFKYKLWEHFPKEYLKDGDPWLEAGSDVALMFGLIEMAGLENCHHIKDVVYYWNDNYSESVPKKLRRKMIKKVRLMPPLKKVEF